MPGLVSLLGGLLAVGAAFLTWLNVTLGDTVVTFSGLGQNNIGVETEGGTDGMLTLGLGAFVVLIGVISAAVRRGAPGFGGVLLLPGLAITGVGAYDRFKDLPGTDTGALSYGIGLYLTIAAGMLVIVGAVMHFVMRRR